jgi:hypothetical protein
MVEALKAKGGNVSYEVVTPFPGGFNAEAFVEPLNMNPLASWSDDALKEWKTAPTENYHDSIGPTFPLKIKAGSGLETIRKSVAFGVKQVLHSKPSIRLKTTNWSFTGLPDSISNEKLNDILRPVWNGMRRLPYSDREIADALASIVALFLLNSEKGPSGWVEMDVFSQCFGESIDVEFANNDGSSSRGVVSCKNLRAALRKDMAELLTPEFKHYTDDVREVFRVVYNPRLTFEWEAFKSMFAREVIPAQAVRERKPILFNPAQLITFGLP